MKRQALAGRFVHNKRGNNYASVATAAVASGKCPVAKFTMKPPYPGPGVVANNEGNPAQELAPFYHTATYWAVPTQSPKCGAPGWAYLSTDDIGKAKQPWSLGGKGKSVNIDHVCKYSTLSHSPVVRTIVLIPILQMKLVSWMNSSNPKTPQTAEAAKSFPTYSTSLILLMRLVAD